ncbi:YceI family protein [Bordetella genomosp. 13]|uniref:YceI family protein n=1 Tax=Bordetella genomosp. 13 TaxID=463040 RepID=UPI0011AA6F2F|nr:YceI family protein [Bordetella genomosp. 13]
MPIRLAFVPLLLAGLAGTMAARAEPVSYAFDQRNAVIEFFPRVGGLLRPTGEFQQFRGSLSLDPAQITHSQATVRMSASLIRVGMPGGASKLRSADYFDAARYPEIDFRSTGLTRGDAGHLTMTGLLTIRGLTRPQSLDVALVPGEAGRGPVAFEARGSIRRSDFGMVADHRMVADEIGLSIKVALDESAVASLRQADADPHIEP